jgi:gluconate 2-dehydrogenase gamma chain
MARIIPTDDLPGATEAGAPEFLVRYLSGISYIYAKPDGSGFETLTGRRATAWTTRIEILRQKYVEGLADLDVRSQARFGAAFADLPHNQQDEVLHELERSGASASTPDEGAAAGPALQQTSAEVALDFFPLLVLHTRQGFYADPIYGGNRDRVGWSVIGFPGPTSLAEVHAGRFTTLQYFAERRAHPQQEDNRGA